MDNKMVLAIVLSAIVLFSYQIFFIEMDEPPLPVDGAPAKVAEPTLQAPAQNDAVPALPATQFSSSPSLDQGLSDQSLRIVDGRDVVLENDLIIATFSTSGGHLQSLRLKEHQEDGRGGAMVEMIRAGYPAFTSVIATPTGNIDLAGLPFTVEQQTDNSVTFHTLLPDGRDVRKQYTLSGAYEFSIRYDMECAPGACAAVTTLPVEIVANVKGDTFSFEGIVHGSADAGLDKIKYSDVSAVRDIRNIGYGGVMDKYFLIAFLPSPQDTFRLFPDIPQRGAALVSPLGTSVTVFAGPKLKGILDTYDVGLSQTIDYGFLSILAAPLMQAIRWFYSLTGNYGVAIILLTVCIKIIFFPLSHKSYKSMKKISVLAPELKKLKEKFKNDPQKLNTATMELYKTHKANPLSGCLPILVQIPVFFALYKTLMNAIELRHAPFALWINDLSALDPYYITPVIMGATMFLQQKMTPTAMDPVQRKIMLSLPIVFTFLFMTFPSGLILYWIVNNVLSIAQQYYINKRPD